MVVWRAALAVLLVVALPASIVNAGSKEAPEVTDPMNDQAVAGAVPIVAQPPAATSVGLNVDLVSGWIQDAGADLLLVIRLQGTGAPTGSSTTTWTFHLETGGKPYDAIATQDMASQQGTGVPGKGTITASGVATSAVAAGDGLIQMTVPKSALGNPSPGSVLSNLFLTATGKSGGQASSITDRAPNTGAGLEYRIEGSEGGAGSGPATTFGNIDTPELRITQGFTTPTNATYIYNWTAGPARAQFNLAVTGTTGVAVIRILDAANATVLDEAGLSIARSGNATGQAGVWLVAIALNGFTGDLSLAMNPAPEVAPGGANPTGSPTSGGTSGSGAGSGTGTSGAAANSTTSGTTSKKSPAPAALLGLAAFGLVVVALRRRLGQA